MPIRAAHLSEPVIRLMTLQMQLRESGSYSTRVWVSAARMLILFILFPGLSDVDGCDAFVVRDVVQVL